MFKKHAARHLSELHGDPQILYTSYYPQLSSYRYEEDIIEQVHKTFSWCHVDKVSQVNCPEMYGMYLLRKNELELENTVVHERTLYHVTTESRGVESLKYGLDWRRTKRSRFGRGVCFSDDADYADHFADNKSGENNRVIIVCKVLVANQARINSGYGLKIPPGTADTTVSATGRVYVKYNDYEFYPVCLVFYWRRPEDLSKSAYVKRSRVELGFGVHDLEAEINGLQQRKQEEQQRRQKEEEKLTQLQYQRQWENPQQQRFNQQQEELQPRVQRDFHQQQQWEQFNRRGNGQQLFSEDDDQQQFIEVKEKGCVIL